jgi:hypothetical protein
MLSPPCESCKYFVPSSMARMSGHCKRFKAHSPDSKHQHEYVFVARIDPTLCGEFGRYFTPVPKTPDE